MPPIAARPAPARERYDRSGVRDMSGIDFLIALWGTRKLWTIAEAGGADDVVTNPVRMQGLVRVPNGPGWGYTLGEEKIRRLRADP